MRTDSPNPLTLRELDRVLDSVPDGLIVIDVTEHVSLWNRRAEELLGWPAVEMIGRRMDETVDRIVARAAAPETVRPNLEEALASPGNSTVEIELTVLPLGAGSSSSTAPAPGTPDSRRFVLARLFPVLDRDDPLPGRGILLHDVTYERQVDAMKSQLLSTVSHELRTPLASIKGFATTLLRQDVKWDDATQRDFLRIIEDETDRLAEIIDNLLDMSQLEAGVLRVDIQPVQLRTQIRDVVDEMRMSTEAHWFVLDLPSDLPQVLADTRRIRQVLHNLVENAIKYSKGGQITVACEIEGDHVTVSVADRGEGIPPQYRDKVFERFFQIDGAATRRVGGSGLGLSISRGIVQAHGGRIWVESTVGHGSTFRFTLPLAPANVF